MKVTFFHRMVIVAVGSVLTFNPVWVIGLCWCAEEGQEGTLLPRPLRSHADNNWAASDSVGWEEMSQAPQAYL